jgi:ribokinase
VSKVVVVGSTNTDLTVRVPRIPAPGETALGREFRMTAGGKGANQAVAAARAGARVVFVTALGTDDFGQRALENLAREGIDISFVRRVADAPSGVALIVVDDEGENSIAVAPGANGQLSPDDVELLASVIEAGDVMLLQLEIPLDTVEAAARIGAACGATVILNPAPARALPHALLGVTTIITPNEHEAQQLTGVEASDERELARSAAVFQGQGVRDVFITLGARGGYALGNGWSTMWRAFTVDTVDTTAAGDVFNGALAASLVNDRTTSEALLFAVAAAAISVTHPGAQSSAPFRADIESFLRERS